MLGKLLKYEFRATGRTLAPLYGALLLMTLVVKFQLFYYTRQGHNLIPQEFLGQLIASLTTILYVALIVAIFVMTLVLLIQRFYKNLLGPEGYLMFTLPVSVHQLILSKLLVALAWTLISGVAAIVSVFILAMDGQAWAQMLRSIGLYLPEIWHTLKGHGLLLTVEIILLGLVGVLQNVLHVYAAIALGHLAKRRRGLASVGGYIGLSVASVVVMQVIGQVLVLIFQNAQVQNWVYTVKQSQMEVIQITEGILLALLLITALFGAAFYFLTHEILRRKLNLE